MRYVTGQWPLYKNFILLFIINKQTFLVVNGDMQTEGEQAGPVKKKKTDHSHINSAAVKQFSIECRK